MGEFERRSVNPPPATRRPELWRSFATLAVLLVGVLASLRMTFSCWGPDSDIATPALLWDGMRRYGLSFLTSFHYTPDNWLLWPFPLFCLVFATLGENPVIVIALGWALFIGCVVLAALIVRQVTQRWTPAIVAAVVLMLSNRSAFGAMGFLSYPVTHNATLLGGLAVLLLLAKWAGRGGLELLLLAGAIAFPCGVSDPWLLAALVVPAGTVALVSCLFARPLPRWRGILLLIVMGVEAAIIHSRLFGLFGFVPVVSTPVESVAGMIATLPLVGRLAAMWLNVIPAFGTVYLWQPHALALGIDGVVFGAVLIGLGMALAVGIRQRGRDPAFELVLLIATVSILLTVAAFIGLRVDKSVQTGRYFMGCYVLLIIAACATVGRSWSLLGRGQRFGWVALVALFAMSGFTSGGSSLWPPREPGQAGRIHSLIALLRRHDLHLGFGTYFGAQASAVTWITAGRITMRPVEFSSETGTIVPRWGQTSPDWFAPVSETQSGADRDGRAFLIVGDEDFGCPTRARCIAAVTRQFGAPVDVFSFEGDSVLVWNYPLLLASAAVRAAHLEPLQPGEVVKTTSDGQGRWILGRGWSFPEAAGTWSDGRQSQILLRLPADLQGPLRVVLRAAAFVRPGQSARQVEVSFAGRPLGKLIVSNAGYADYSVTLPPDAVQDGSGVLSLAFSDVASPAELRLSTDPRELALSLNSVSIADASPSDGTATDVIVPAASTRPSGSGS